jgi:hypothetical protein
MTDNDTLPPGEYALVLAQAWLFAAMINQLPLERMVAAQATADALGALMDPTLYREKHVALSQDKALCEALLTVKQAVDKMADPAVHAKMREAHAILGVIFGPADDGRPTTPHPQPN